MSSQYNDLTQRLKQHVETLAVAPRVPASKQHTAARSYIQQQLKQYGVATDAQTVSLQDMMQCTNIMTSPFPANPDLPLVIVGAHYDTIPDSPGADDNASAVAALIELTRLLQPRLHNAGPLGAALQLVSYDLEEYGMLGSYQHCRQVKADGRAVRAMLSLEMLAYTNSRPGSQQIPPALKHLYPDVGNFIGVVGNDASLELLQTVVQAMKGIDGLAVECLSVPGDGRELAEARLSDHSNFWDEDYPALMITDTSFYRNPHYHQPSDTPETLDIPFLAQVTAGVCEAVWRLLQ